MIGVDISPLVLERRRGVARALSTLLAGWSAIERPVPVRLLAPRALDAGDDIPTLDGVQVAKPAVDTARSFRRQLPALARQADLTVFFSPWLATPRLDVPTLVWVHELPFVRLGPIEGRLRALRQRAWLRKHERQGRHLVVPSTATAHDIGQLRDGLAAYTSVVPHGFDPTPWRAAARPPVEPPYVVVLGTGKGAAGAKKKGIDLIGPLARRLSGRLRVHVIGDTHEPDTRVRELVSGARALVYPSRSEGFGFPPLEAMAAGVPVVATTAGAIPEVVGDAACLVAPGNLDALQDAVLAVAFDEHVRARLKSAGTQRADAFPPAQAATKMQALLQRIAKSPLAIASEASG